MEMMDSAGPPLAQSTSEVDNRFNGWSAPLFKVALCPLSLSFSAPTSSFPSSSRIWIAHSAPPEESNFFNGGSES